MFVKTNFPVVCSVSGVSVAVLCPLTSSCVSYIVNLSDLTRLEATVDIYFPGQHNSILGYVCLSSSLHGPFILSFLLKFIL